MTCPATCCFQPTTDCPNHTVQCQLESGHTGPHQHEHLQWHDCCELHNCVNKTHHTGTGELCQDA